MKKVLLINPEETKGKFNFLGITEDEPVDIEGIYTVLKDTNIDVIIFDPDRDKLRIEEVLQTFTPDLTYILGGIKQSEYILDYAQKVKSNGSLVAIGGLYAEYNFENFYKEYVDFVVKSFNPYVILDIIKEKEYKEINGICYKDGGKWISNPTNSFNINDLPVTNREHFYKYQDNFCFFGIKGVSHIRSAYSCPNNCTFCYRAIANQSTYSVKDIEGFVNEIEGIKTKTIYIVDDNFLVDEKRLKKFIKLIKKKNIKKEFICFGRVDFIVKHKSTMKELYNIGFRHIMIGLEATNDTLMNKYNKNTSVNDNADCMSFLNETGFITYGMFIVDIDFEKEDFKNLYKWAYDNKLVYSILSIYTPMPGTKLYNDYKNKFITNNPKHWDFTHLVVKPTKLSIKSFYFNYYKLSLKLMILGKRRDGYKFINFKKKAFSFLFKRSRK